MKGAHWQSLVYSMVARDEVVLAHYSAFPTASASFRALATACLPNLRASATSVSAATNEIQSYTRNAHKFHFLIDKNFTYPVVSDILERDKISSTFLHRIKEDFRKRYGDANTANSELFKSHSLDTDFGTRLKEHMQYCLDHYEKLKKINSIKDQTSEVQGIVANNIEKVLDRRDSIELKIDNDEIFRAHVENFQRQGKQLKKEAWRRQVKLRLLAILVSGVLVVSIWLIVCRGFICE